MSDFKLVGTGPRHVIAFNGWLGDAGSWGSMFDAIAPECATFALLDYPGYGAARTAPGPYGFARHAARALSLADELGWQTFSVMGHSMGGVAMQHVWLQAPDRVSAMIGIAPVPARGSRMDADRLAFFQTAVDDLTVRQKIFGVSTGNRWSTAWLQTMASASAHAMVPDAMRAYLQEWATVDISERVRGARLPVAVIVGENDPTLSQAVMRETWMLDYPDATLAVIPGAGHYPMYESPPALGTHVQAFLNDHIRL